MLEKQARGGAERRSPTLVGGTATAVLLSGLVLPGLGQIFLKRHMRGAVIIALLVVGFVLLVFFSIQDILTLSGRLQLEADIVDPSTVLRLAADTFSHRGSSYKACLIYIAALWIFSVLDAWRIGRFMPRRQTVREPGTDQASTHPKNDSR